MIRAIITDIEGTTSSISFVHEVLFPYSRRELPRFLREHHHEPSVAKCLADVAREAGRALSLEEAIAQLEQWIAEDKKITPLKALQGMIWEFGYNNGDFKGHVYADAYAQLKAWDQAGIKLFVYSSGSIHAQKLLFGHTDYGDLTPLFSGYFDTTIGHKREETAYRAIVKTIGIPAEHVLFLSDIKEELDAARAAGMKTTWLVRDKQQIEAAPAHPQVNSFDQIAL